MKTSIPTREQQQVKKWFLVDVEGQVLGRVATKVAAILRGKHKAQFVKHMDMGDHVIIVNADKVRVTGKKLEDKIYYSHSGYNSGLKSIPLKRMMERRPTKALEAAIEGMIPANKLAKSVLTKLHLYAGADHPHAAQKPESITF